MYKSIIAGLLPGLVLAAIPGLAQAQSVQRIRCTTDTGRVLDWTVNFETRRIRYRDAGEVSVMNSDFDPQEFNIDVGEFDNYVNYWHRGEHTGRTARVFFFYQMVFVEFVTSFEGSVVGMLWQEWPNDDPASVTSSGGRCVPR